MYSLDGALGRGLELDARARDDHAHGPIGEDRVRDLTVDGETNAVSLRDLHPQPVSVEALRLASLHRSLIATDPIPGRGTPSDRIVHVQSTTIPRTAWVTAYRRLAVAC